VIEPLRPVDESAYRDDPRWYEGFSPLSWPSVAFILGSVLTFLFPQYYGVFIAIATIGFLVGLVQFILSRRRTARAKRK
jgi:uncharacterized membrane protein